MNASVAVAKGSAIGAGFARALNALQVWRERRREIARLTRELQTYSDRELAEIGLCRGDIPDVARGRFATA
jgi:uncharacterized protein YjiS (DUF1127 family)